MKNIGCPIFYGQPSFIDNVAKMELRNLVNYCFL